MNSAVFFLSYFAWHYGRAFRDLLNVWANFFWFILQFFSIALLLRTLFSPFKRITEEHNRKGFEDFAATVVANLMTRIVGAITRLVVICVGLLVLLIWIICLVALLVFWALAPIALAGMLIYGIGLLFI